ncbi:MAG: hypothetical protein ACR2JJ_00430, partial [Sphingomicrobium sp.]
MVEENEKPEVTDEGAEHAQTEVPANEVAEKGVAQAQTEVPAKEDVVIATEGTAEPAPQAPPEQQQQ